MTGEFSLAIYMSLGIAAAMAVGFSSPKLTEAQPGEVESQEFIELVQAETSHCQDTMADVNCACFAQKSSHVMNNQSPRIRDVRYHQPQHLARSQAGSTC